MHRKVIAQDVDQLLLAHDDSLALTSPHAIHISSGPSPLYREVIACVFASERDVYRAHALLGYELHVILRFPEATGQGSGTRVRISK